MFAYISFSIFGFYDGLAKLAARPNGKQQGGHLDGLKQDRSNKQPPKRCESITGARHFSPTQ
jgi:hypothetical protein